MFLLILGGVKVTDLPRGIGRGIPRPSRHRRTLSLSGWIGVILMILYLPLLFLFKLFRCCDIRLHLDSDIAS